METLTNEFCQIVFVASLLGPTLNILKVMLGLGLVVFFHELGHFAVAKWCDVHVERFSIGFGPIIWSRQKGETEYALSALPLGGYVKMLGQDDMDPNQMTSDEIAENPRSYSAKKVWQRMAIISAGVIMNVVTGFLFFATAYRMGVIENVPMVGSVTPGGPADTAGLVPGDIIDKIDDDKIYGFQDVHQAIILSGGDLTVRGQRADGSDLELKVSPKVIGLAPRIGLLPANKSIINSDTKPENVTSFGLPARSVQNGFLPGDRIVKMNDQPVTYLHDMSEITARDAAVDINYEIQRPVVADGDKDNSQEQKTETKNIVVPPQPMKELGLWMAIGNITFVRPGSIADQAGLKEGYQIHQVDDLVVSQDIDPLRLPNYFASKAGQTVTVMIKNQTESEGVEEKTIEVIPDDSPAWDHRPSSPWDPLMISSLGLGFHVQPRIAHVVPDSEAAGFDIKFEPNQKVASVTLFAAKDNENKDIPDQLNNATELIDFEDLLSNKPAGSKLNWAYIFWLIQQSPNRSVMISIEESNGAEAFANTLVKKEYAEDWYLPIRGIGGFVPHDRQRKAESWSEALFTLGQYKTRSSVIQIYTMLRSLFVGRLSAKALSGPVGIVKAGTYFADSGLPDLLLFLGFLSINLAVLNFLPIPVLDGGHMVFLIYEAVARRKPSPAIVQTAHIIGFVFILCLFAFVMYLDLFENR